MTATKMRRDRGLPKNDAADKIWNDHLGNNAFVWHRDQCETCLKVYKTRLLEPPTWCPDSARLLDESARLQHHAQCSACLEAYREALQKRPPAWCPEGDRIFNQMLDEVCAQMDEAIENQN